LFSIGESLSFARGEERMAKSNKGAIMNLITKKYVIEHFPKWEDFFLDDSDEPNDEVLASEIKIAEAKLLEYVFVTADTITEALRVHLLNIVAYRGFILKHGDTEFENEPQIIKDYNATIAMLEKYKAGESTVIPNDIDDSDNVAITAKERKFDRWFN
jgi:hypothetical protein